MESDARNHTSVVHELVNYIFSAQIPQLNASVVGARRNHARVKRELRGSHPVGMTFERLTELSLVNVPNLNELVI